MTAKRILVPLDGTAKSNAALPLARTLAKAISASVTLLRVLPPAQDQASQNGHSTLDKIADELALSGLSVESLVRYGEAAEQIIQEIQTRPTELVVLRTHARVGIERALLGSVTEHLLTHTSVPLVLMRPGERRVTRIQKLLVPVDGSPGGAAALGAAIALARATGASIMLVEVAVPTAMQVGIAYEYGGMGYFDPAWDDEVLSSAKVYVQALVARMRSQGLSVDGEAFMGPSVVEGIANIAEKESIDLVIMSTHALTGPARALLGSVADAVVRTAPCPVLLLRRTTQAEEDSDTTSETVAATMEHAVGHTGNNPEHHRPGENTGQGLRV